MSAKKKVDKGNNIDYSLIERKRLYRAMIRIFQFAAKMFKMLEDGEEV